MDVTKGCESINKQFPRCAQMRLGITGFESSLAPTRPIRDAIIKDFLNAALTQEEKDWLKGHGLEAHLSCRSGHALVPDTIVFSLTENHPLRTEWARTSWPYSFEAVSVKRRTPQKVAQQGRHTRLWCHYVLEPAKRAATSIPKFALEMKLGEVVSAYEKYARWVEIQKAAKSGTAEISYSDLKLLKAVTTAVANNSVVFGVFYPNCHRNPITGRKAQTQLTEAWTNFEMERENDA